MNKLLKDLNYSTLSFFLINSFIINLGINSLTTINNNDSIIDIFIGGILLILFLIILLKIKKHYKKDLIDIIFSFKYLKYPIIFFLIIILILSSTYSLITLTSFIHNYMLKEVSTFTISITLILTIAYLVSKGINTITRISEICFYIYMITFILGIIGLYNYINLENIKPLFISSINNHIKTSFTFFISSLLPIFLILSMKDNTNNKGVVTFTIFSLLLILLQSLFIISVLGINLTNIYKNPDIMIYKKISFLNILERVEVFLAFNNLLNSLFIITISFYLLKRIINKIIKIKKESITLTLLTIIFIFLTNTLIINKDIYILLNFSLIIIFLIIIIHFIYSYIHQTLNRV